ncbi:hypothetical protein [Acinetobacter haemolyticus]|uniref:hypothetical protein n=1 Tax=Acinetobacter haemolyticus TaxID=29430 RepID=UPI000E143E04|nr:hypothetical protein [Acinetobacter haemolyticus]WPO66395.1 hypothetical protein SDC64_10670 [Acinetobacter haemolyticus]SUU22818.1 Uncharacterised protein [Acinetobacter haemolyticus]
MELIIVIILVVLSTVLIYRTLKKPSVRKVASKNNFREVVKKAFPKHKIIDKNQQIMICEINHRNEPDELVFIRIGRAKNIQKDGRRVIIYYPTEPTASELKRDLSKFLI